MTLTAELAGFITSTVYQGIPEPAVAAARRAVLDWIGSAIRGGETEPATIAQVVAARTMDGDDATVLATRQQLSVLGAAFANGVASHALELDDLHQAAALHPGAPIIAAALAVAERDRLHGRSFLRAVTLGYEVGIRVAEAIGPSHYRYWHPTATCGVFGAAAAAGILLDLTREQMVQALGTAGTQAAGLWAFLDDGAMSKPLHAGKAAHDGVLAAELALNGVTGARAILEGPRGLFAAMSADADPSRITDGLGKRFAVTEVSFKRHACCGHTHAAIDAALALRAEIGGRPIARVEIDTYPVALEMTDHPAPATPDAARFSIQYAVASALTRGHAQLDDFRPERLADPAVRALLERTVVRVDPELSRLYPNRWPARVTVTLADGERLATTVEAPGGTAANPLSDAELAEKFHGLVDPIVGEAAATAIVRASERLIEGAPVRALIDPLWRRVAPRR